MTNKEKLKHVYFDKEVKFPENGLMYHELMKQVDSMTDDEVDSLLSCESEHAGECGACVNGGWVPCA